MFRYGEEVAEGRENLQDALKELGIDYEVAKQPRVYVTPPPLPMKIITDPGRFRTYNTRTGVTLGDVSEKYTFYQAERAFKWVDTLVAKHDAQIVMGGSMSGTSKSLIWLAVDAMEAEIVEGDIVKLYLTGWNSYDGTTSVGIRYTPYRLNSSTQLSMKNTHGAEYDEVSIRHSSQGESQLESVFDNCLFLPDAKAYFENVVSLLKQMVETPMKDEAEVQTTIMQLLGVSNKDILVYLSGNADVKKQPRWVGISNSIFGRWKLGLDNVSCKNTLYAVYNAVIGYYEHEAVGRNNENGPIATANSQMFGTLYESRVKAASVADGIVCMN